MNPFGFTRSHTARNYALVAPESHVPTDLPRWTDTDGIIVVSPGMGARFAQYFALMAAGGTAGPAPAGGPEVRLCRAGPAAAAAGGAVVHPGPGRFRLRAGGHAPCHDGRRRMPVEAFRKALPGCGIGAL